MQSPNLIELESSASMARESAFNVIVKSKVVAGLLILFAIALFIDAIVGLKLLYNFQINGAVHTNEEFILATGLVVIPLLLLGILIGVGARHFERLKLAKGYHARIDQLQKRLNHREDLLSLVSDHQAGAIAVFDRHNRYWYVNKRASENLSKTAIEIIGQPPIRILGDDKAKRLEVRLAEARAADGPIEAIDRIVDETGNTHFMQVRYEAIAQSAELSGCVLMSEDDLTNLFVERERRERMLRQVIKTLVAVVDRRDPYAAGHSERVGQLARAIASEMGLDERQMEAAEIAGSLMNFGKVLVSRHILTKTTALTAEELQRVRDSILTSSDILAIIGFEGPVVPTLRQVLERYDGMGVPEGLRGESILVTARIVTAANSFVALVSPRAHRDGLSFKEAIQRMMDDAGKMYDQRVLIAMSNYIENRPNKLDWLMAAK